jgi:hypothetical protein
VSAISTWARELARDCLVHLAVGGVVAVALVVSLVNREPARGEVLH